MHADLVRRLEPCPFCGNDGSGPIESALQIHHNEPDYVHDFRHTWTVQCDKCTATMGYSDSEDEAIAAWNRRAQALECPVAQPVPDESNTLSELAVRSALLNAHAKAGSYAALAKEIGISDEFARQMCRGERPITGKALEYLGYVQEPRRYTSISVAQPVPVAEPIAVVEEVIGPGTRRIATIADLAVGEKLYATPQPASAGPVVALEEGSVADAFLKLCEEIGIPATAGAYLEYRSRTLSSPTPVGVSEASKSDDLVTDEDRIAYWKGAYERMAARNVSVCSALKDAILILDDLASGQGLDIPIEQVIRDLNAVVHAGG